MPHAQPTVYAHVATDPSYPGQLALQYWMFYVYNDWNNLHEGDWEMIQLNFSAPTAEAALASGDHPYEVGYSQHTGGEKAGWGDSKLQIVGGTHPVVYPAAGLARQLLRLGALPGVVGRAGGRVRRHPQRRSPAHASRRHDPQRHDRGSGAVPVDRVRGVLGRAPAGVLQRPHRAQHEDPVDAPDHVVARLAVAGLRRPGRRRARHRHDRLLLRR